MRASRSNHRVGKSSRGAISPTSDDWADLFSVPGAFTPTCNAKHLPGYIDKAGALRAKGVDKVVCLAVNDVFVMGAWGKAAGAGDSVVMAADGNGDYTRALGLELDARGFGMGMRGQRFALVIEDGPTATHGGMGYGAGLVAARRSGASAIVDPRPYAVGLIAEAFRDYPHLHDVLPALGYGERELKDLEETIDRADCDVVVIGTPIDLSRVIRIRKPVVRATYAYEEASRPGLAGLLVERFALG